MSYYVEIRSSEGTGLRGTIYFNAAGGDPLGESVIPIGGTNVDPPEGTMHYLVTAPGYNFYGTSQLYEDGNTFTLVKPEPVLLYTLIGGVVAYIIARLTLKKGHG